MIKGGKCHILLCPLLKVQIYKDIGDKPQNSKICRLFGFQHLIKNKKRKGIS